MNMADDRSKPRAHWILGLSCSRTAIVPLTIATTLALSVVAARAGSETAEEGKQIATLADSSEPAESRQMPVAKGSLAEQYCLAAREAAREARHAVQMAQLGKLMDDLDARIKTLDARIETIKEWMEARQKFASRATGKLVEIFASMRPESASAQLALMDQMTAAAIISRLEPRVSSAILNDMPAEKAAQIAAILSAVSKKPKAGNGS